MAQRILIEWRPKFSQTVRSRGMDYYQMNRVRNMEREGSVFTAEVIGSGGRHYLTRVALSSDFTQVRHLSCTCPYSEDGSHCKHEAAILYAIEDKIKSIDTLPADTDIPEEKTKSKKVPTKEQMGGSCYKLDKKKHVYYEDDNSQSGTNEGTGIDDNLSMVMNYRYYNYADIIRSAQIPSDVWKKGVAIAVSGAMNIVRVSFRQANPHDRIYDRHPEWAHDKVCVIVGRLKDSFFETNIVLGPDYLLSAQCYVISCRGGIYGPGREGSSVCQHEAALLYMARDLLEKHGMEVDATDAGGEDIMKLLSRERRISAILESNVTTGGRQEPLDIEPNLSTYDHNLTVTFRVGGSRKYKIQRLNEFYHNVISGGKMRFGKSEFQLGEDFLSDHGKKVFEFLRNIAMETGYAAPGLSVFRTRTEHDLSNYKDEIMLYGHFLDDFYDMCAGTTIPASGLLYLIGEDPSYVSFGDDNIQARVVISNMRDKAGNARGINVHGEMPLIFRGQRYAYFIKRGRMNRIGTEDAQILRPFSAISQDGVFDFQIGIRNLTKFYYETLPWLREHAEVTFEDAQWLEQYLMPQASFTFFMDRDNGFVTCKPMAAYGNIERNLVMPMDRSDTFRDFITEGDVLTLLRHYFPMTSRDDGLMMCEESRNEELVYELLHHGLDELVTLGEVRHTDSFLALQVRKYPSIKVGVSLESSLMDLEISADDMTPEELLDLLDSYRKKKKYYRLRSGDFISVEGEAIENLSRIMEDMHIDLKSFVNGKMQLPAYRALYLDRMLEAGSDIYEHRDRRFKKLIQEFKTISEAEFELPAGLHANMRKYQEEGYQWIRTLAKYGFGGILADEMGLGKTLQTIAVLQAFKETWQQEDHESGTSIHHTSLIVVPASLVYNWGEELRRFAPDLTYMLITGTKEEREDKIMGIESVDVAVTSYDLLKRDIAEYDDHNFAYQIIDEAQYIKTHTSQAAKSVKLIHADHRMALTGTPIENRLSELWSIFDYLMPGLLYTYEQFRSEFEIPVMKYEEEGVMDRLRAMVTPFILRRKKSDVLKDLPDKLEEIRYAQMDDDQKRLYDAQVLHMKKRLEKQSEEEYSRNKIEILAELTRIRQICCDPALCFEDYKGSSAKTDVCMDMISQVIEGEHKALIFSQFVTMLAILKRRLDEEHIPYYEITGSTPKEKRIELVNAFNSDKTPVFLISLKAGGTGLNLTGADVVIHYDPWWNLAVQNQATDRAHRIGQKNVVTVFKLIAHGTIEDKIVEMQEKKRALAENILGSEGISSATLSKDDLMELLG